MTHLEFVEIDTPPSRRTKVFHVMSTFDNTFLGTITWNPYWRQYWLEPESGCGWTHDCLLECSIFIKGLMDERKSNKLKSAKLVMLDDKLSVVESIEVSKCDDCSFPVDNCQCNNPVWKYTNR